jgi:hypothetical protein
MSKRPHQEYEGESKQESKRESKQKSERKSKEESKRKSKIAYDSLFPKNLVLFITTHGRICVWDNAEDEPEDFTIPESIQNLFKLNLAPPGVSSRMTALSIQDVSDSYKASDLSKSLKVTEKATDLNKIFEIIQETRAKSPRLSTTYNLNYLQRFMTVLQNKIKPFYEEQMPKDDSYFVEERDTLPKAVNLYTWIDSTTPVEMSGENQFVHLRTERIPGKPRKPRKMVNKRFLTDNPFTEHSASPLNFSILALNLNDNTYRNIVPDILSSTSKQSRSTQNALFLDTSDILKFVSNIKDAEGNAIVESVLMLDTSCANFHDEIEKHKASLTVFSTRIGYGGSNKKTKRKKSIKRNSRKKSKMSYKKKLKI